MKKVIKELEQRFQSISWSYHSPKLEVVDEYGEGLLLRGVKQGKVKEFYVLDKDKQLLRWGVVIANELGDENVTSTDS